MTFDGTLIPAAKRSNYINDKTRPASLMLSDPDAGWYVRAGHVDGKCGMAGGWNVKTDENASDWEATLVYGVVRNTVQYSQPHLILGSAFDSPSRKPAIRVLQAMRLLMGNPDTPRGFVICDRAYFAVSKTEDYYEPLPKAGHILVGDLKRNQLGRTTQYETMSMVEGDWNFPAMQAHLETVTQAFQAGTIDQQLCEERIAELATYAMRRKGKYDAGDTQVPMCPARGKDKTAVCPLAQRADHDETTNPVKSG